MKWITHYILLFFFLFSCAHKGSGHYIQIERQSSWKQLSKAYGVPAWKIVAVNKEIQSPSIGSWVFIPLKRGILGNTQSFYSPLAMIDNGQYLWPVPSSKRVSSHFGKRWGRAHEGIDISARSGASIVATEKGVVVYSGAGLGGYGNTTVIAHPNGFFSVYAHAKKNHTKKGQKVHRGQVIAEVGSTGRSTGNHLHFEIRHESKAIDPGKIVQK